MENRARYGLIGAFVLVCILAGFGFVYWIANTGGIGARSVYTIRFEQPVSGLLPGANVLFNGVRVGAVSAIALDPAEPLYPASPTKQRPGPHVRCASCATPSRRSRYRSERSRDSRALCWTRPK